MAGGDKFWLVDVHIRQVQTRYHIEPTFLGAALSFSGFRYSRSPQISPVSLLSLEDDVEVQLLTIAKRAVASTH
jgi:hypothetical protein